ncbi:putative F-box domain-containing protein [Medicago truncatula]|uniref:F-box protein n=1 Tax=Medicago truncatula TaxID=3880 RepID=A0A072UA28_MEDTR|nr:SKP1-interacting partner 15 [Medicago truncatula]KEH26271.1 F-box protein [Medicago truncatula]RHN51475.1 putative F-box domain-containing protein [Medicago truncatula]
MEEEEVLIYNLPQDTLHKIFSTLPFRQIIFCRSLSKFFNHLLTTPSFLNLISSTPPPLNLLTIHHKKSTTLRFFDLDLNDWIHFPLNFLPFSSLLPVASSDGLIYLWAEGINNSPISQTLTTTSLVSCNPLTRQFRIHPPCPPGFVLVDSVNRIMILTEFAIYYFSGDSNDSTHGWQKLSSNLPSKPRSPILIEDSAYVLCNVGSRQRSEWKLFSCCVTSAISHVTWSRLTRPECGVVFDILKRPQIVRGVGNKILIIGSLKSTFKLNPPCSTILILRLDLGTMEWEEVGRMPIEMFSYFQDAGEFKVFGGGDRVFFPAKRIGKLALWDRSDSKGDEWRWIDNIPGKGDGLYRGFVFEGRFNALP